MSLKTTINLIKQLFKQIKLKKEQNVKEQVQKNKYKRTFYKRTLASKSRKIELGILPIKINLC